LRREEEYFGGNRQQTLERDGFRCTKILPNGKRCKNRTNLVVHHIDGRGRSVSKANRNNELSNLMTMCRGCHIDEHRVSRKKYSDATIRKIRIAAKIMSIPAVAKKFGMNHSYCYNIVRGTARSSVQ
jgi:5-methylcytosine-specific restriction endonuclease McrA